ncbi:hypothetical protein DFH08DRAFT_1008303 [Mycena albidolilacea]|uniref:Bacteriophage T5 Orf172 DNA-binding domain-containing protein n=1 Tax=Mycena albidolilacea TaxID=1033008 RepID=A0AAD6ZZZ9_9AGAR|nr:hypothetical protein DFH08DRAFT_1008303 [Mycena albidolilacea]
MVHITNLPVVRPVTELAVELVQYNAHVWCLCQTRSRDESKECGLKVSKMNNQKSKGESLWFQGMKGACTRGFSKKWHETQVPFPLSLMLVTAIVRIQNGAKTNKKDGERLLYVNLMPGELKLYELLFGGGSAQIIEHVGRTRFRSPSVILQAFLRLCDTRKKWRPPFGRNICNCAAAVDQDTHAGARIFKQGGTDTSTDHQIVRHNHQDIAGAREESSLGGWGHGCTLPATTHPKQNVIRSGIRSLAFFQILAHLKAKIWVLLICFFTSPWLLYVRVQGFLYLLLCLEPELFDLLTAGILTAAELQNESAWECKIGKSEDVERHLRQYTVCDPDGQQPPSFFTVFVVSTVVRWPCLIHLVLTSMDSYVACPDCGIALCEFFDVQRSRGLKLEGNPSCHLSLIEINIRIFLEENLP